MKLILIYIASIIILHFLPWWGIIFFAALIALSYKKLKDVIIYNVLLGIISWGLPFIYYYFNNGEIIINRISEMLSLDHSILLLMITILVSSIISVSAGLTFFYLKKIYENN